ncbi:MAG: fructosamine kinase family protein [Flavobacteriales bacterium]
MAREEDWSTALMDVLRKELDRAVTLMGVTPVGGGSINDAYRMETSAGKYFVKLNSMDRYPSMFAAEADGLQRLRDTGSVRVPNVLAVGELPSHTYLLLEHIDATTPTLAFWKRCGHALARMHRHTDMLFGLDRDNYIGSMKQVNTPATEWSAFFIHHRLEPQLKHARDHGKVEAGMAFRFERLFARLEGLFPREVPALLHGDLWSGNLLCDDRQQPVLIDPAVYHGHREMDIAMTRLFGGVDDEFTRAYNDEWPMEPGWEERQDVCNLYPLLVHVNLFGGSYARQVESILRRFT